MFLNFLNLKEVEKYVMHRLKIANGENINIDPKVFEELYKNTEGIPRLINSVMSKALMSAYLENSQVIKPHHIRSALKSLLKEEKEKKIFKTIILLAIPAFIYFNITLSFKITSSIFMPREPLTKTTG
jgi:Type II secretory pathway, component ExeA (predicted ATPase)